MKKQILVILFLVLVVLLVAQEYKLVQEPVDEDYSIFWIQEIDTLEIVKVSLYGIKAVDKIGAAVAIRGVATLLQPGVKRKIEFVERIEDVHYIVIKIIGDGTKLPVNFNDILVEQGLYYKTK